MERLVDTHIHAWDLQRAEYSWLHNDTSILNRTWRIEELEDERMKAGVTDGVLVQAAGNDEDSALMFEIAESVPWISGVVAWLPLEEPARMEKKLTEYRRNKYFKGVRHQVHDEPDAKWLLRAPVVESLGILANAGIPYDIVGIKDAHIETVLQVSVKIDGLKMVFDHLNQPPIASKQRFGSWGSLMKEAAGNGNLFVKISGLGTTAGKGQQWSVDDVAPYIEFVLEHFGVERCFCGSDWPVSELAGRYSTTWKIYKEAIERLVKTGDREKIFYTNATAFYRL